LSTGTTVSLRGFLLLFVASRLLYLVLIDPSHLSPQLGDELYQGTIAQELVTGLSMPFVEYRGSNYMLGTLVMGALAAGFFYLFGPTLFALKLASLLVFTLALAFWYWTIERASGRQVAGSIAILFCASPPLFTAFSVATLGDHANSILFTALTVFLLFRMLSEEKHSLASPVLLGLTAGFGLWFAYIYGLTLLALLVFWLWHDRERFWRPRVLWFTLGFLAGFSPWILMNLQTNFAGLVVHDRNMREVFGLAYLWEGLTNPRRLFPYEFFADIASDDPHDQHRRAVNLLYSLLYLGPILTAGVLCLKTGRFAPTTPRTTRPTLVGFALLYLVVFALAVLFSDFRKTRYHLPAYPFLFFLVAHSVAYCQNLLPLIEKKIQAAFLTSVAVLGLGTHAPLLSLERPGFTLSAKGYAYAFMPETYLWTHGALLYSHAAGVSWDHTSVAKLVQRPLLSDILPKLAADDKRELSRGIALLLADAATVNGQVEDFARIEQAVPPGFDREFYYLVGAAALGRSRTELSKGIEAVEFLRHRTPAMHHLALIGLCRTWPTVAALDSSPDALAKMPAPVPPELAPHYWRAIGSLAVRYWYDTERSLSLLKTHLHEFVPRLDPEVQSYVLQGVGEGLFHRLIDAPWIPPAELERFPYAYQESLLEGWGMAFAELDRFSELPWHGQASPYWMTLTKGLSTKSLSSVQQGKTLFDALFGRPASSELKPPPHP
jgi:4-amino-4-deoxy-L-arabinose transferase-like glycosyltransferase